MAPLALALHLALAAPGVTSPAAPSGPSLAPRLDPGPFRSGELALASIGTLVGDVLVLGGGYLTLQLFANGTVEPSAANFRRAAYVLGVSALVVPPLAAVLLARITARGTAPGGFWKALLLATAGQAAALAAGYWGAPHYWLVLPVQLGAVSLATSFGLHWGARPGRPEPLARPRAAPAEPAVAQSAEPTASVLPFPVCPDA
jgi:hypothetical protein